jgi:hypothetical protein
MCKEVSLFVVFRKRQELVLQVDELTYTSTVSGTYSELNTGARSHTINHDSWDIRGASFTGQNVFLCHEVKIILTWR